jgi:hypothetical protein
VPLEHHGPGPAPKPQRQHQPPMQGELTHPRRRHVGRFRRHDDPVIRSTIRHAARAVGDDDPYLRVPGQRGQPPVWSVTSGSMSTSLPHPSARSAPRSGPWTGSAPALLMSLPGREFGYPPAKLRPAQIHMAEAARVLPNARLGRSVQATQTIAGCHRQRQVRRQYDRLIEAVVDRSISLRRTDCPGAARDRG